MSRFLHWIPLLLLVGSLADAQPLPALSGVEKLAEHRSALDTVLMMRGPLDEQDRERRGSGWLRLEGSSVLTYFRLQPDTASLQVLRDYQRALEAAGFDILFTCETSDGSCYRTREGWSPDTAPYSLALHYDAMPELPRLEQDFIRNYFGTRARYLLAQRADQERQGDQYVSLTLAEHSRGNHAFLRELTTDQSAATSTPDAAVAALLADLQRDGTTVLRGLRFRPGSAQLQLGADKALMTLAGVLHAAPSLRLAVVAHADRDTPSERAGALALERAQTLVDALVKDEGIAAMRLQARAGTPAVASAPSGTDTRVELVTLAPE